MTLFLFLRSQCVNLCFLLLLFSTSYPGYVRELPGACMLATATNVLALAHPSCVPESIAPRCPSPPQLCSRKSDVAKNNPRPKKGISLVRFRVLGKRKQKDSCHANFQVKQTSKSVTVLYLNLKRHLGALGHLCYHGSNIRSINSTCTAKLSWELPHVCLKLSKVDISTDGDI